MKRILFAIIAQVVWLTGMGWTLPAQCQYVHSGDAIQINNDTMMLIRTKETSNSTRGSIDTLAICNIRQVNNDCYEINSLGYDADSIFYNMAVAQNRVAADTDGIIVYFKLPQWGFKSYSNDIAISIPQTDAEPSETIYNQEIGAVLHIPSDTRKFRFNVVMKKKRIGANSTTADDGREYAINIVISPEVIVNEDVNIICITIPNLSPWKLFNRYKVEGEYMEVAKDKIKWRGITYRRLSDQ